MFKEAIALADIQTQALPSPDVPTPWNSTYLMIDSALPYREAFVKLSISDANFTTCPTSEQWTELLALQNFLQAFNTGTFQFSTM